MNSPRFCYAQFAAPLLAAVLLNGCSTVASRIREERTASDKLPPDYQVPVGR
jgi:uncharacterized protein YceK